MTYGAIVVPILHEFKAEQVHNIVNHSDARLLLPRHGLAYARCRSHAPNSEGIIHIPDFMLLVSRKEELTEAASA